MAQSLTQYVATLGNGHAQIAMSIVVPTLLSRAASEGTDVYHETSARLLELASADQAGFRGVVAAMNEGQKAFMEEVIRSGRQSGGPAKSSSTQGQPSIALKMDFGG